jgi:hypothetical protein
MGFAVEGIEAGAVVYTSSLVDVLVRQSVFVREMTVIK